MEKFLKKLNKFIYNLKFRNKVVYRILFLDNSPKEMINEVLNPMIMNNKISKEVLDKYSLIDEFKNTTKNNKDILTEISDIVAFSPKYQTNIDFYLLFRKSKLNDISKIFHYFDVNNINNSLDEVLDTYRKFKTEVKDDDEIILLNITINKEAQFLPVKQENFLSIEDNNINLVLPPIYKWKLNKNMNLYELIENKNKKNKNNLIDDIRYMNKYPNLNVYHYILTNKLK